jgi:ribosomal protein L13
MPRAACPPKNSKKTAFEKRALLEEVKGKTKKECERILAREIPQMIPKEKERILTPTHTEVRVILNEEQLQKLNRLRALLSHKNPDPTYAELIEMLSDLALKKIDPLEQKDKTKKTTSSQAPTPTPPAEFKGEIKEEKLKWKVQTPKASRSKGLEIPSGLSSRKPIPRPLRRAVFQNSRGKCSRCGSTHLLEIDHMIPKARGGADAFTNLRVLCRSCNQYEAMRAFGSVLLRRYLAKLRD